MKINSKTKVQTLTKDIVKSFNNKELLASSEAHVKNERQAYEFTNWHFDEIQSRKLYISCGYESLYKMLVGFYKYCEASAYQRVRVINLIEEVPEIAESLNLGELNITNLDRAQSFIKSYEKKNNSLKLFSAAHATTSQDLRAALAMAPARLTEAPATLALKDLAVSGKLTKALAQGLCSYWIRELNKEAIQPVYTQNALLKCGLRAGQPESLFMVEKRLFVKELGGYQYVKGYNEGISIGNNITLTKSHAKSNYVTKSLTFNMGLTQKFADVFSMGVSGSYAISQSAQDAEASANSTSVSSTISLMMQQNIYKLKLKRYRECSIVRMNPKLFATKGAFDGLLKPGYSEAQKAEIATRGIMVCAGQDNTTPVERKESYYMLTQELTSTQSQDNGDERNRNFFIAVRGEKEFARLMYFMRGSLKTPNSAGTEHDEQKATVTGLDALMNTGTTNVPGAYSEMAP
jgi:hypothetical protein